MAKQHVPLCCRNDACSKFRKLHWHNYVSSEKKHVFVGQASGLQCFMLTSKFGLTTSFLEQLHLRMVREHASFAGEADVMTMFAKQKGLKEKLPKKLRRYLSNAWFLWRLCLRLQALEERGHPDRAIDMRRSVEESIAEHWETLHEEAEALTAERVRSTGMRADVQVIDGNAKNRRCVCAAPLRHVMKSRRLRRSIRTCCTRTPLLGSKFCRCHGANPDDVIDDIDFEIIAHETKAAVGDEDDDVLHLQIQRKDGLDTLWVPEEDVHQALVKQYFRQLGAQHLDALTARKKQRVLARKGWLQVMETAMAEVGDQWHGMSDAEKAAALPERSSQEDLAAVVCKTHKESTSEIAKLSRTAGVLCACISSGVVVLMREIFGCESLSQRYFFLADLVGLYPECTMVVHDDACHLHKFAARRADASETAARLAPPNVRYVCDLFHMSGHTDEWCMLHCNPKSPDVAPVLQGIRTSVCEFTFTWLSGYKFQTKHMSEWGFKFFLQEMILAHNDSLFSADK